MSSQSSEFATLIERVRGQGFDAVRADMEACLYRMNRMELAEARRAARRVPDSTTSRAIVGLVDDAEANLDWISSPRG